MRRFIVIGQKATASPDFSLLDIAGTSGRLDVLLRCIRAALMVSHGLRSDTVLYLVLLGGPRAPRTVRIEGAIARFLRPDERSLAVLLQKALSVSQGDPAHVPYGRTAEDDEQDRKSERAGGFLPLRRGIAVVDGGLEAVLRDIGPATYYVLEEGASDVRDAPLDLDHAVFVLGDHQGFDPSARAHLAQMGAAPLGLGPVSIHTDDAITVVSNELDRRDANRARASQT